MIAGTTQSAPRREAAPAPQPERASDCLTLQQRYPLPQGARDITAADVTDICGDAGEGFALDKALFFDTETTGLSGGAGTLAFLCGLGWVEGDSFVVEQLFLRDYGEEEALLRRLEARLQGFTHLVTYNGKTFDVPLMQTRGTLLRMRTGIGELRHIDLIHPARRVWKLRLDNCALGTLEEAVLGVSRDVDIPGSEVPQRYFDYLKTGDFSSMREVIEHNRQDIVTLLLLLDEMARLFRAPLEAGFQEDVYSLGRALLRGGDDARAEECFSATRFGNVASRASGSLAALFKRRRELGAAMRVWLDMEARCLGGTMPYTELSKAYEHQLKDPAEALRHVEMGISFATARGDRAALTELLHRRQRLVKKLQAAAGQSAPADSGSIEDVIDAFTRGDSAQ